MFFNNMSSYYKPHHKTCKHNTQNKLVQTEKLGLKTDIQLGNNVKTEPESV